SQRGRGGSRGGSRTCSTYPDSTLRPAASPPNRPAAARRRGLPHSPETLPQHKAVDAGEGAMTMLWQEISWVDVEAYLKNDDRAIVPVGSCEQHGRHLSFVTDYLVPVEIGRPFSSLP